MTPPTPLQPAAELAARAPSRFPNESAEYRRARTALLAEEIALRRHLERVAALRRQLPAGGPVPEDYVFEGEHGPVRLSQLFGRHDTLITYHWMFGPQREQPCPMCTALLSALDGEAPDLMQRVGFAVIARSPVARMAAFAQQRGWRHMPLVSAGGNAFSQHYAHEVPGGEDHPAITVFMRDASGTIRLFWAAEMGMETADPGQDPRDAPDLMPLWNLLDLTPGGRGTDWYPQLSYDTAGGCCGS